MDKPLLHIECPTGLPSDVTLILTDPETGEETMLDAYVVEVTWKAVVDELATATVIFERVGFIGIAVLDEAQAVEAPGSSR